VDSLDLRLALASMAVKALLSCDVRPFRRLSREVGRCQVTIAHVLLSMWGSVTLLLIGGGAASPPA
jgi:hypothetical protein